jgi:hypothetical protein
MKSRWFVITIVVVLAALVVAGAAFAQVPTPPTSPDPYDGRGGYGGMMGGRGGYGGMRGGFGGMMGGYADGLYGPMHEYMIGAFAEALGLSPDILEERIANGENMWTIAQEQGLTDEQFQQVKYDARIDAMQQAVEAGVITQEWADWMIERMKTMHSNGYTPGYGAGSCPGMGGGRGGSQRWNTQPVQPEGQS